MNIGTTSIDSLPISPQTSDMGGNGGGNNIRLETYEKNMPVANPMQALQQERDNDPAIMQKNLNQFVTGIQQASAAGLTALPSRDIPKNQAHIAQDAQIQPNYIPQPQQFDGLGGGGRGDYIREHQSNEDIIRAQAQKQDKKDSLEHLYEEVQMPLLIGILYFLFQLPVVQKQLCKFIPALFNKDGNPKLSGYIVTSAAFASIFFILTKSMRFLEK
jgi:hypothetical protein